MAELVLEVAAKAIAAKTEVNLFIFFRIEGYSVAGKRAGLSELAVQILIGADLAGPDFLVSLLI